MRRFVALVVLVAACSSSTSHGVKLPDWSGWARWEHTERGITKPVAEVIAIGKRNKLDTCDPVGAKAAFGTAGTERIEGDWFFLCGEGFATDAVEGSDASGTVKASALDKIDQLERTYGKH